MRAHDVEVLICGAGAAGMTLAIELARRNVAFRLIDKLDGPFRGSRGKGLQPRSLEVFEDLGILDRITAAGGTYPAQRVYQADGTSADASVFDVQPSTPNTPYGTPLIVPQFQTEAMMRERLAELGHRPEFGLELTHFVQEQDGVTVHLNGASGLQTLRARYLIGTDGGRSVVRQLLGIHFAGENLGVRAVVADVVVPGLSREVWHRFNRSPKDQVALCPLGNTDLFQLQFPIFDDEDVDLSAHNLTSLIAARTGRSDLVIQSVSWASAYGMSARLADRYQDGQIFLAGDAAHTHPPTGGQGLNTSVQDAYNLGWKLAAVINGGPPALLASYEAERRPIAADMLGLATRLLEAAKQGSMQRGREAQQLDLGYPDSTLTLQGAKAYARAGYRAPDAPLIGAAGQPTRLFNLFKGIHWTLLGYEPTTGLRIPSRPGVHTHTIGPGCELIEMQQHVRDGYGIAAGDWVLVRPDGYVAAIVSSAELEGLERYLEDVGLGQINA